jgi:hypothetical protein
MIFNRRYLLPTNLGAPSDGKTIAPTKRQSAVSAWENHPLRSSTRFSDPQKILMDRYIAHRAHLCPWKLGMLLDEVRRGAVDLDYGLADGLNVANDSVLNLQVVLRGLEVGYRLKVTCRSFNRFRNMFRIVFDALRMLDRGWVCCSTSLRNFGNVIQTIPSCAAVKGRSSDDRLARVFTRKSNSRKLIARAPPAVKTTLRR